MLTARLRSGALRVVTTNPVVLFGPDVVFLSLFTLMLGILVETYDLHLTFLQGTFVLPIVCLGAFAMVSYISRLHTVASGRGHGFPKPIEILQDWLPFVLIAFVYENLHEFTYLLGSTTSDQALRSLDQLLFRTDIPLALQRITTPWLTEYMTFAYALYFVFPTILLGVLYGRGERYKFRELTWALSLCFYIGFIGYLTVPAVGPRFVLAHEFTVPLTGIWLTSRAAAAWNSVERVQRDCFPSLHTAISTISLIYLWRYRLEWKHGRILLWISTPLIVSLWASTLYLRYHWGVDVLAGWALAIGCCKAAPLIARWYYARKLGMVPALSTDRRPALGPTGEPVPAWDVENAA